MATLESGEGEGLRLTSKEVNTMKERSAREIYKNLLKERLRKRLRERLNLQKPNEKQSRKVIPFRKSNEGRPER